jgi:hypothetical protein
MYRDPTDSIEKARNREILLLASKNVFQAQVIQKIAVSLAFGGNGVPKDGL